MKIANIISKDNLSNIPDYINYANNYEDRIIGLPTLIVGWKLVKEIFNNDNFESDILNKVIDIKTNLYWTFSKFEKRDAFEKDVETFYNTAIDVLSKKVNYKYFSILLNPLSRIKDLINFINSKQDKIIYIHNNRMVYIYNQKTILGLSLDEMEYIGLDKEKVVRKLYMNSDYNFKCDVAEILIENNDLVNKLKENIKLIPLVYCGE